ncbi:MAG: WhiB family transcriptional regulator [Humibacillus sp.]|nr:WhiB family transcriptional regulator [Humibacillus sp.]MDN5779248.1 WhiB family transcriptional regulator [Humibacillus sp.]
MRHSARDRLNAALAEMTLQGRAPRCARSGAATSEDPAERAYAADHCPGCPLLVPCAETGAEERHTFGVWGGVDRTPRAYARKDST